jgi:MFS superfamily sulfate permease-like transporter
LGAANLGAGLFQGFSIGSSLSKSAANDRAGAKTPVALIVCAILTALVALFFTPFFAPLPEAVLGAVVIVAIMGMVKVKAIRRLYQLNRVDFALAIVAVLGVLTFEALEGLMIAVILSLLALVWRASQANLSVIGREPGRLVFSDSQRHPENRTIPGLLIVRPDQGLFFANVESLSNEINQLVEAAQSPVKVVLLDLEMTNQLDVPSLDMLSELKEEMHKRGAELWLVRVHGAVRDSLEKGNVLEQIGLENIYPRIIGGILTYLTREPMEGDEKIGVVNDGLKMTLETVDDLLKSPTTEKRAELEAIRQKLAEVLQSTDSYSLK